MSSMPKLSINNLLEVVRNAFSKVSDPGSTSRQQFSLVDCLMSGLAIFGLKLPSLLQFEHLKKDEIIISNLKTLYGIENVPSDSRLRERLDEIHPEELRGAYKKIFATLQRGKVLEPYAYMDNHYILSIDGTGQYSSTKIHCEQCCVKKHRNGKVSYYHNMVAGSIVHPNHKEVFPFPPEPILKQDGVIKNDCEQNATRRFLEKLRTEHPHLKFIVVQDSLSATGPHIKLLNSLNMRYILVSKQNDQAFNYFSEEIVNSFEMTDDAGVNHQFRFANQVRINGTNMDVKVNMIEYKEIQKGKVIRTWTWVTDLTVNNDNLMEIMRAARSRWRIENETFNTLKNQGYNFEHNFGHGYKHLSTVFSNLMMLAFLIDQIQQRCCNLFKEGVLATKSKMMFWERLRSYFTTMTVSGWEIIYQLISKKLKYQIVFDTS